MLRTRLEQSGSLLVAETPAPLESGLSSTHAYRHRRQVHPVALRHDKAKIAWNGRRELEVVGLAISNLLNRLPHDRAFSRKIRTVLRHSGATSCVVTAGAAAAVKPETPSP